MQEKTRELLKKFQEENEIYVSATEALTYWVVYARVTRSPSAGTSHPHHGIKYVTGPNEDGNVLVMREPFASDVYSAESWGPMATIDDFVKLALEQILVDKNAADKGQEEGCGTSCG
jgi:hypothetical protein